MQKRKPIVALSLALTLALAAIAAPCQAEIQWSLSQEVKLDAKAIDEATSPDGQWLYLLARGQIMVFSVIEAKVVKTIPIDASYDHIAFSAQNSSLILVSSSGKPLKMIRLDAVYAFDISSLAILGPAKAPVTITVFSDYQCPYCAKLFTALKQVMEKHPSDVRLVVKSFPLASHAFAQKAAMAALAANAQGKFWEFHDRLFENLSSLSDAKVLEIAKELKLDLARFQKDQDSPELRKLIVRDVAEGNTAGVTGTPSVFVNGKAQKNQSPTGFEAAIAEALAASK